MPRPQILSRPSVGYCKKERVQESIAPTALPRRANHSKWYNPIGMTSHGASTFQTIVFAFFVLTHQPPAPCLLWLPSLPYPHAASTVWADHTVCDDPFHCNVVAMLPYPSSPLYQCTENTTNNHICILQGTVNFRSHASRAGALENTLNESVALLYVVVW